MLPINRFFDDLWTGGWTTFSVPDGYEVVEKADHKIKRLKDTVDGYEKLIEFYSKKLVKAKKDLKDAS